VGFNGLLDSYLFIVKQEQCNIFRQPPVGG